MVESSVSKLFLQYIDYNYLLGGLFVLSLGYYVGKSFRSDKRLGGAVLLALLFPFLTVFNPLVYKCIISISDSSASYYRFIWTLPLVSLSACFLAEMVSLVRHTMVKLCSRTASAHKNLFGLAAAILVALILCSSILSSGTSYLTKENLAVPENKFNISRATLDISQFIQDDADHQDGDVILAPTEIMMELLAYDITLVPALPRTEYINYKKEPSVYEPLLSLILEGPSTPWHHFENVRYNLNSLNVKYVVTLTLFDLDFYMENAEYYVYNRTGDYTLYKRGH